MIFNRINMSALDRLILTDKDIKTITGVLEELTKDKTLLEKVMESDMPFDTKGVLKYEVTSFEHISKLLGETPTGQFYFNLSNPKGMELTELDDEGNMLYRVVFDPNSGAHETHAFKKLKRMSEREMVEIMKHMLLAILDFFRYSQYVNYIKQDNPIVIKRANINQNSQKTARKTTRADRTVVSVSKPKKVYDYEQAERDGEKRSYERQAESWEVAGHWRQYKKSGKRVFVKGYRKGEGIKKGKDYTV